jgi:hypothetical protein
VTEDRKRDTLRANESPEAAFSAESENGTVDCRMKHR